LSSVRKGKTTLNSVECRGFRPKMKGRREAQKKKGEVKETVPQKPKKKKSKGRGGVLWKNEPPQRKRKIRPIRLRV